MTGFLASGPGTPVPGIFIVVNLLLVMTVLYALLLRSSLFPETPVQFLALGPDLWPYPASLLLFFTTLPAIFMTAVIGLP